jgi:hypothetical protein
MLDGEEHRVGSRAYEALEAVAMLLGRFDLREADNQLIVQPPI